MRGISVFSENYPYIELRSKVLSFGITQINLFFHSLNRTFAADLLRGGVTQCHSNARVSCTGMFFVTLVEMKKSLNYPLKKRI